MKRLRSQATCPISDLLFVYLFVYLHCVRSNKDNQVIFSDILLDILLVFHTCTFTLDVGTPGDLVDIFEFL